MRTYKRVLSGVLAAATLAGMLTLPASAAGFSRSKTYTNGQFTDVASNAWYNTSVKDCYELGLMSGSSATTFNPTGMFTLAEVATVAGRMHHIYNGGNGVLPAAKSGAWYQGAVDYCIQNGIIGKGDYADYTRGATRAEVAQIMAAALPDSAWTAKNNITALPDVSAANDGYEAIFKLYNAGVFTGSDEYGQFQPYAFITRAEVAAIVARCADASLRKTVSLTPLSQRQAPEVPANARWNKMSDGRLKFQDPDTGKYGFLNGYGQVVIPAVYEDVKDFVDGYAVVLQNRKWGMIDVNGKVTLPIENSGVYDCYATKDGRTALVVHGKQVTDYVYNNDIVLIDGLYKAYRYGMGTGVLNAQGAVVIPMQYKSVGSNGIYFWAEEYDAHKVEKPYHVYDRTGKELFRAEGVSFNNGNLLVRVREGNKYAVFGPNGRITEAFYDDVRLYQDGELAIVKYGNLTGLVGLNGEIFAPGSVYSVEDIYGDHALIAPEKRDDYAIADATGIVCSLGKVGTELTFVGEDYFVTHSSLYSYYAVFTKDGTHVGGVTLTGGGDGYARWNDAEGYYWFDGRWPDRMDDLFAVGPYAKEENKRSDGEYFYAFSNDGENWNYFGDSVYRIQKNDAGKPVLCYGNGVDGWTPVIEFYKNNMYYDDIKEIGEGYYACRFNTTWYLVHA